MARAEGEVLPRPVVKWAGGKSRLVDSLLRWMPSRMETYAEPFCGGAAVFFALAAEKPRRYKRAVLVDKNEELVACYRAIRDDLRSLVTILEAYQETHHGYDEEARRAHFYEVRARATSKLSDAERGARLLFLNKTCFNGLWRVNASGSFNVPFGRYAKPKILDRPALEAARRALAEVDVRVSDFATAVRHLGPRDFVYFDPPYVPVSKTSNFTSYAQGGFGPEDQRRLVDELTRLRSVGALAMLSNAASPETVKLYAAFPNQHRVPMRRAINSNPDKRGVVDELVVLNYRPRESRRTKVAS